MHKPHAPRFSSGSSADAFMCRCARAGLCLRLPSEWRTIEHTQLHVRKHAPRAALRIGAEAERTHLCAAQHASAHAQAHARSSSGASSLTLLKQSRHAACASIRQPSERKTSKRTVCVAGDRAETQRVPQLLCRMCAARVRSSSDSESEVNTRRVPLHACQSDCASTCLSSERRRADTRCVTLLVRKPHDMPALRLRAGAERA